MNQDPFDVLGLEPHFDLDPEALDRRVRELGRALHPDRHATATAGARRQALGRSIDVTAAERELRDPVSRALALRRRLAEGTGELATTASPALLMEILEKREALAEARRTGDVALVARLSEPVKRREEALLQALDERFSRALEGGNLDLQALDTELGELRYLRRFLDEAAAILDEAS
jgi:molecular chaperone HscB